MIEVMVAILLTAIATSGIIGLYIVETRASGFSRHSTEATVLAQDQIEILRTAKFIGGPITTTTVPSLSGRSLRSNCFPESGGWRCEQCFRRLGGGVRGRR